MKNKRIQELLIEKERLFKEKQTLHSWNHFYLNSSENLYATRYHKARAIDKNGDEISVDVWLKDMWHPNYGQAISFSNRFREDRRNSIALNKNIKSNFNNISKNHKEISDEYDKIDN